MRLVVCALVGLISSYLLIDTPATASETRDLYQRAATAIANKDLSGATELLSALTEQHSTSPLAEVAAFHLAECHLLQSRPLQAVRVLHRWDEQIAQSPTAERLSPGIKLKMRQLVPRVLQSLKDDPATLEVLEQQLANAAGELTKLATQIDLAIALELVARYERAQDFRRARYWLRQVVEASEGAEKQLRANKLQFELPLVWAESAISRHEPKEAVEVLQAALAKVPTADQELPLRFLLAEAHFAAGDSLLATKQFDWLAQHAADQQSELQPVAPPWLAAVTLRRGELLIRCREIHTARELLIRAKREQADFAMAYEFDYLLARCAVARIEFDEATQLLHTVVAAAGETEAAARAGWLLGEVYFLQRQYQLAIAAYAPVSRLEQFPQWQARAWLQSAKCHELLGDTQAALADYKRATELNQRGEVTQEAAQRMAVIETANLR